MHWKLFLFKWNKGKWVTAKKWKYNQNIEMAAQFHWKTKQVNWTLRVTKGEISNEMNYIALTKYQKNDL